MNHELLYSLAIFFGIIGFFFILVVVVCLWEKRSIQPYYQPEAGEEFTPLPLANEANNDAVKSGYVHGGIFHSGKEKIYRIRCDFWISPDYSTLAVVGSGTVAKIVTNGISFCSWTEDGRILCTTNEIGEQDISGVEEQITWSKFKFRALAKKHNQRLETTEVTALSSDSPLANYFEIGRVKANAMVARKYAYFIDDEETIWRHSLKGALAFYFITVWIRPLRRLFRKLGLVRD
ncbi:MAG: hypothetical protein K0U86_10320 [Planctomycetes bacterium]|nr:hypothetical protein [Planctomycetota bacterium]MCH9725285.1 hypothetical protein [Planctomycetota bacterium]MCH9779495.1 hypothetical protein [Planctomycetota bacterium]MCH9792632.1 hypothetical protein [Planctomycetota bacterium]MDF1742410.1 hypothetical protein [Gimesia sp.]